MTNNFDTADVLETQLALLQRMQSQATRTLLQEATISKRKLLNFAHEVEEFAKDFIALNERTINMIRRPANAETPSNDGTQLPDGGSPESNPGAGDKA